MSLPTHHNVPQQRCITIWNVAIVSFATQQIPIVQQRNKILSTYAVQWPKVTHCQTIFGPRDIVTTTYTGILTRIGRFPPWRDQWWPHPSVLTGLQEAVTQTYTWYTLLLSHVFFKHSLYSCHGPHKTKGKHSRNIKKLKHLLPSELKPSIYFSLVRDRYNNMYFS